MKWLLVAIVLAISIRSTVFAYTILVLSPADTHGEKIPMLPFIDELLYRQHSIVHVTSVPIKKKMRVTTNYTEILFEQTEMRYGKADGIENFRFQSYVSFTAIFDIKRWTLESSLNSLKTPKVQDLIHSPDKFHFDLIIYQECSQESWLMFAHKYNAPILVIGTTVTQDYWENKLGLIGPHAIVSHGLLPYTDKMNIFERALSVFYTIAEDFYRRVYHLREQNSVANQAFFSLKSKPSLEQIIMDRVSMVLIYSHPALFSPRPALPNMINIGGAHLTKPKKLPSNIRKFLDGAEDGVIYFSLGSVLNMEDMSVHRKNMFIEAFRNIRQRVLWRTKDRINLENVMTSSWFPQNDVLAHPNIVLFITQGGTYSIFEAIANSVPMLIIPFNHNHNRNAIKAKNAGYAEYIHFTALTTDQLHNKLRLMLVIKNEQYQMKASEVANILNDNLVAPMDEAIFWIEYVCEFKGAEHLKTYARQQSWIQYLLIDVFLSNVLTFVLIACFLKMLRLICC